MSCTREPRGFPVMSFKSGFIPLIFFGIVAPSTLLAQTQTSSPLAPPMYMGVESSTPQAKQFRLGNLRITGNTHTKLFVIMRMIPLVEGDIFNQPLWDFGLDQLNRSGL